MTRCEDIDSGSEVGELPNPVSAVAGSDGNRFGTISGGVGPCIFAFVSGADDNVNTKVEQLERKSQICTIRLIEHTHC